MPKYTILILTHNRLDAVMDCFGSLEATLAREDVDCYVLDNASTDGSREWLHDSGSLALILDSTTNLGVSAGRAKLLGSIQESSDRLEEEGYSDTPKYIVFLDSDTVVTDDGWLDMLGGFLDANPQYGAVGEGGSMVLPDWSGFIAGVPDSEVDCLAGYLVMFRANLLQHGLHMDAETYPGFWVEDSDFCLQIRDLGFDIYCLFAGVLHNPSHSGMGQAPKLFEDHFAAFRARWQGRGLVKVEGAY